jgi:hypothetical protein
MCICTDLELEDQNYLCKFIPPLGVDNDPSIKGKKSDWWRYTCFIVCSIGRAEILKSNYEVVEVIDVSVLEG